MSKRILVTGAAGFIGSHTSQAFLARGDTVIGLDNLNDYYDPAIKRANLEAVKRVANRGGLFTFDPLFVNGKKGPGYTPDHRQRGAAFTAQNQRTMVWPLLKSGDFDFFPTAFRFYLKGLPNTMARVRHYWNHEGCAYEEQGV